ncbi:right-handed parallel beta-helix repeat-containing protein [Candidatus Sumerlaeota bacterium]|nr:right-handed parallel beta-helix repeat-containing protein [Candidatus Sumerlaeota bacterium]
MTYKRMMLSAQGSRAALWFVFLAFLIFVPCGFCGDYYVFTSGSDLTGDGTQLKPWASIGKALSSASASDVDPARIRIAYGAYVETLVLPDYFELYGGYESLNWNRNILIHQTVIRPSDPLSLTPVVTTAQGAILDGLYIQKGTRGVSISDSSPVINQCTISEMSTAGIIVSGSASSPEILNNTITNSKEGIYFYGGDSPVIKNNVIRNNTGNAITVQNATPVIEKNNLRENGMYGLVLYYVFSGTVSSNQMLRNKQSGIVCYASTPLIVNNRIAFNLVGGIYCREGSAPQIYFNTLYLNGNGIALQSSSPEIINNISLTNESYGIMESYSDSDPMLVNNCLWGNKMGNYKDEGTTVSWTTADFAALIDNGGASVEGNFAENPMLADVAHENFYLLPYSPCIDAAYYLSGIIEDFEGNLRDPLLQDIGADEYSSSFYYSFDLGSEGWDVISAEPAYTAPLFSAENGNLVIRSTDNATFGFWESPNYAIPVFENTLYRGVWKIFTDVEDQSMVPGLRIRLNEEDFQTAGEHMVNSNLNGDASPTTTGSNYRLFFRPLQGSSMKQEKAGHVLCAFDMINLTPTDKPDGALFLEEFTLEWISLASIEDQFTTITIFDFAGDALGWEYRSAPAVFDEATPIVTSTYIGLRAVSAKTFSYWESPPQTVTAGVLYRARFYVSTDVTNRSIVPMARLRENSLINQSSDMIIVDSSGNGDSSPVPGEWTKYDLYFVCPPSVEANGILLAFDLVNLNKKDKADGALFLDRVEIHSMPDPVFP